MNRPRSRDGSWRSAAVVCSHVAGGARPILYAERTEAEDEADSGWQFVCGESDDDWHIAQVWALQEVVSEEPSVAAFVELPVGTVLRRRFSGSAWMISKK